MPEGEWGGLSASYKVFETRQFLRDLARLGPAVQKRLEAILREQVYPVLRENPYGGPNIKRLQNWEPHNWRYGVGGWRLFDEVDTKKGVVFMIAADRRKEAYR